MPKQSTLGPNGEPLTVQASLAEKKLSAPTRVMGPNRVQAAHPSLNYDPQGELYDDLMAIGRSEKKMDVEVLRKYPRLLGCYEVQRRAESSAGDDEHAEHAVTIIQEWVSQLPNELDRDIMTAALAIDPKFYGKTIDQRERMLPGVTNNIFKKRRRKLLGELVRYLHGDRHRPASQSHLTGVTFDELPKTTQDAISYVMGATARSALILHFATLACLFPHHLDAKTGIRSVRGTFDNDVEACMAHMFRSYIGFRTMTDQFRSIPLELRAHRGYNKTADREVGSLIDSVNECWQLRDAFDEDALFDVVLRPVIVSGYTPYDLDLLNYVWKPWYLDQIETGDPARLQAIATPCRLAAEKIGVFIGTQVREAIFDVKRVLESYYGCSLSTAVRGKQSLNDYFDQYCLEQSGPLLRRKFYDMIDIV